MTLDERVCWMFSLSPYISWTCSTYWYLSNNYVSPRVTDQVVLVLPVSVFFFWSNIIFLNSKPFISLSHSLNLKNTTFPTILFSSQSLACHPPPGALHGPRGPGALLIQGPWSSRASAALFCNNFTIKRSLFREMCVWQFADCGNSIHDLSVQI